MIKLFSFAFMAVVLKKFGTDNVSLIRSRFLKCFKEILAFILTKC